MLGLGTNKTINAYWWRPRTGPHNFGDELGAIILRHYGFKVKRVSLATADYLLTGTLLDTAENKNDTATVIGSGAGHTHDAQHNFNVLAVRGKLTALVLNTPNVAFGDLGLLASRVWTKEPAQYDIGVVRHYVDNDEYPFADIVIDASEPVEQVIKKISSCRVIMSSSLHGIIVADSYGIPNMRIARDDVITGDWKWLDHKSALIKPVSDIQDDLIAVLGAL
jgi:exopolysaccharide biosynthesis predicted pyruvyltransferase EpsI